MRGPVTIPLYRGRGPRPGDSIRIVAQSPTDGRTAGTTILYPTEEAAK